MLANQKMVASDGLEVALFPLPYLFMTQDEGGDFSHVGTYNIDFQGWSASGRVYKAPIYAPCTVKCVDLSYDTADHNMVFESVDKVHLADGTIDYLTITFAHSDTYLHSVGDVIEQGEVLCYTGTTGYVTGDHTHTCCGKGRYIGYSARPGGHFDLTNRVHYWFAVYVNDTVIIDGYNHPWTIFSDDLLRIKKDKFPWVLYARKIRERTNV